MGIKQQVEVAEKLLEGFEAPILPKAALDLQKLFSENALPSPDKVKNLISMNPFLAGELVSLANIPSLSNAVGVQIKDLDSAIYRLGNKRLKNYILSIYIKNIISEHKIKGLSYHSQDIALIASNIARFNKLVAPDEAYLLGLVHDIGAFILGEKDDNYGDLFVVKQIRHYIMESDELTKYGTTHSALGYVIAKSWNLPNYIAQTILLHHTRHIRAIENNKLRNLIAMMELAHSISVIKNHKQDPCPDAQKIVAECCEILDLTNDEFDDIFTSC